MNSILGRFLANTGYGSVRGGLLFINTLVLTPILISRLGRERFAILALATPFLRYGFNGVFDLGLNTALVRFVSRDFAAGDEKGINQYFTAALALYIAAGVSMLALYPLISPFMLRSVVGANSELYSATKVAISHLLWIYILLLVSNPFFAMLMGIQRVYLSHFVGALSLLIELIGILAILQFGITISDVVIVYAVGAVISALVSILLVRHHFPLLRLSSTFRKNVVELTRYTAQWSVTVSASVLSPVIDKLILARFVGLSFVAIYEAAARLVEVLRRATQLFLLPLFPIAGAMVPNQPEEQTRAFYRRIFSANIVLNAGLYLIPAALSFALVRIWLGPELSGNVGFALWILALTQFMLALVYPGVLMLAGTGELRLLVNAGIAALSLNVFVSPLLAKYFGFSGVLAGTIFAYGGQSLLILVGLQRRKMFALDVSSFLRTVLVAVFSALCPSLLLITILRGELGVATVIGAGVASVCTYCFGILCLPENRKIATAVISQCHTVIRSWVASRMKEHAFRAEG